jgi:hypothetical protein
MVGFVVGIVAAGGAALYWLTSSEKEAKAKEQEREICTGCTQAAMENRLEDIVKFVEYPCRQCTTAVEQYSSPLINSLSTIGALPSVDTYDGVQQYNCYHRNDPMQVYQSPQAIDCRPLFGGNGISPMDAKAEAERLRIAREVIRMKANRPLAGLLSGI